MTRLTLVLVAAGLLLAACTQAPVTGRQQLVLISEDQASEMGLQAYQQILQERGVARNASQTEMVRRVGSRIAQVSDLPGAKWQFNLINDDTPNAFALPGGYVGVNTGLFKVVKSEAQLAAVVGHEIGHVVARHSAERISRQMLVETGTSVLLGATGTQGLSELAGAAATLGLVLPFSRDQESEADAIGLQYMAKAGYDPRAAVEVWRNFQAAGGPGVPEFMSTHPDSGNRIANLEAMMPQALTLYRQSGGK